MRIERGLSWVWAYVRGAPGTHLWLAVLFATTVALHSMPPEFGENFLRHRSTNLHELSRNPVRVLVASAMWIESGHWLPYAFLFTVFHAPAERWLGTARWLAVCALAHVLASLASEALLLAAIRTGRAPLTAVDTLDIGVSYALAGVIAVLGHRIAVPWRYGYLAAVFAVFTLPLAAGPTFTDAGHLLAALTGLACRPLVAGRGKARNPKETPVAPRG
ncbi:rhomboid-like protein [Streptomyces sp. NPDC038707]|uniref:rhomboid-like protein n=1 Tax=Streptomyces sp. NPDC038707 TaxID=3154329 RepID=UPI0033EC32E7